MAQHPNNSENLSTDQDHLVVLIAAHPDPGPRPDSCARRPPWRRQDWLPRLVGWHCLSCWRHERQT
jgi:hypothetical protein